MPIFEYYCNKCDDTQEHIVKNNKEKVKCKNCGKISKRVFPNKMSFKLKGRGWFKTGGY